MLTVVYFKLRLYFLWVFTVLLVISLMAVVYSKTDAAEKEKYPNKPITIVVPTGPGGTTDRLARGLVQFMLKDVGQPLLIVNKPGAGSFIGHDYFFRQPADGYTFMVTTAHPHLSNNILLLGAKFTHDDFDYVNVIWRDKTGLYMSNKKPWKTMSELIKNIKAEPGKRSMTAAYVSSGHIAMLAMLDALGLPSNAVRMVHYDSGAENRTPVMGGIVDFTVTQVEGMDPYKEFLTPLTIWEDQRDADLKDVPTIHEVLSEFKTDCPNIVGSLRTFVAHAQFKKKFPDRYDFIQKVLKRTLEQKDFVSWCEKQNIGHDWFGPEKSAKLIRENFDVLKKYRHLFEVKK